MLQGRPERKLARRSEGDNIFVKKRRKAFSASCKELKGNSFWFKNSSRVAGLRTVSIQNGGEVGKHRMLGEADAESDGRACVGIEPISLGREQKAASLQTPWRPAHRRLPPAKSIQRRRTGCLVTLGCCHRSHCGEIFPHINGT